MESPAASLTGPFGQRCPLCGGPNGCAVAGCGGFAEGCWCKSAWFSPSLLGRAAAAPGEAACICAACVAAEKAATGRPSA